MFELFKIELDEEVVQGCIGGCERGCRDGCWNGCQRFTIRDIV